MENDCGLKNHHDRKQMSAQVYNETRLDVSMIDLWSLCPVLLAKL